MDETNKIELVVDKDLIGHLYINGIEQKDVTRAYILCEPQHYELEIEYNDRNENGVFYTKDCEIVKVIRKFDFSR